MTDSADHAREHQAREQQAKDKEQSAREQLAKGAEAKQKSVEEANSNKGKPTPTQEENDLAALGVPVETHQDDGSGPSPEYRTTVVRESEAAKPAGGSYSTRSTVAKEPKEHERKPNT